MTVCANLVYRGSYVEQSERLKLNTHVISIPPGSVAQSVGHLNRKSEILGSIPGRSGPILRFLLPLIQEGHLSVTGESMCTKYWLTA